MPRSSALTALLSGGNRRSLGSSGALVPQVIRKPAMIPHLLRLLRSEDPIVSVRAADVLEKAQRELPASVFTPFRTELLELAHRVRSLSCAGISRKCFRDSCCRGYNGVRLPLLWSHTSAIEVRSSEFRHCRRSLNYLRTTLCLKCSLVIASIERCAVPRPSERALGCYWRNSSESTPANCCKRLTKRRLFAVGLAAH